MKRYAAAYDVRESKGNIVTKVYWTRAEDMQIAVENFKFFVKEQSTQTITGVYPMHCMEK